MRSHLVWYVGNHIARKSFFLLIVAFSPWVTRLSGGDDNIAQISACLRYRIFLGIVVALSLVHPPFLQSLQAVHDEEIRLW